MAKPRSTNGKKMYTYRILMGNTERKRSLGRPGLGCEDNDKIYPIGIIWGSLDWIHVAEDT